MRRECHECLHLYSFSLNKQYFLALHLHLVKLSNIHQSKLITITHRLADFLKIFFFLEITIRFTVEHIYHHCSSVGRVSTPGNGRSWV